MRMLVVIGAVFAIAVSAVPARSSHYPTSRAALAWRPPAGFIYEAWCIHRHESTDWHRRWLTWDDKPSKYAGGMQFLQSTWDRAGGSGEPWQWSPREQIYRSWRIWRSYARSWRAGSWSEWGSRRKCGLS